MLRRSSQISELLDLSLRGREGREGGEGGEGGREGGREQRSVMTRHLFLVPSLPPSLPPSPSSLPEHLGNLHSSRLEHDRPEHFHLPQQGESLVARGGLCQEALLEIEADTAGLPVVLDELGRKERREGGRKGE